MFRNGLGLAKKVLCSKPIYLNPSPELCVSSCYTGIYDVRRCIRGEDVQRPLLLPTERSFLSSRHIMVPSSPSPLPIRQILPVRRPLLSTGYVLPDSSNKRLFFTDFKMPHPSVSIAHDFIHMVKCIDPKDINHAPPLTYWVTMASAAAQLGIPLLELIVGYSPIMTYLQLYIAATSLAWNGGQAWGLAMAHQFQPDDEIQPDGEIQPDDEIHPKEAYRQTINMSLTPAGLAILGLLLPYPLGFLTVTSGLVTSLYLDFKSSMYPPWAMASKLIVTLSSAIGLLLALVAYLLFQDRENAKKNKSKVPFDDREKDYKKEDV